MIGKMVLLIMKRVLSEEKIQIFQSCMNNIIPASGSCLPCERALLQHSNYFPSCYVSSAHKVFFAAVISATEGNESLAKIFFFFLRVYYANTPEKDCLLIKAVKKEVYPIIMDQRNKRILEKMIYKKTINKGYTVCITTKVSARN